MEAINTVQINKKTRVVAYYDEFADNPTENFSDVVSIHEIKKTTHKSGMDSGADTSGSAIDSIYEYNDDYETKIEKHFQKQGTACKVLDLEASRHYYGEFVFYIEPSKLEEIGPDAAGYLDDCIAEYQQYLDGNIYIVAVEKLVVYRSSVGGKIEQWEQIDSVSGVYDDVYDDEKLLELASDFFGIKKSK